jgi:hypothetical protein
MHMILVMVDNVHDDAMGAGAVPSGGWSTNSRHPDELGLPQSLLDDLRRVLVGAGRLPRDAERLVRLVASSDSEAVADILRARPPERTAWFSPISGYLHEVEAGYLVAEKDVPAEDYAPDALQQDTWGGGFRYAVGEREGWFFGPLGGRELRVSVGGEVKAGEPLTDDVCDPHELLRILGLRQAISSVASRLASLSSLDREGAEQVVRPLFDVVGVLGRSTRMTEADGLVPDRFCTTKHFQIEAGRTIGRALHDLPPSADPRLHALANIRDDAERWSLYLDQKLLRLRSPRGCRSNFQWVVGCTGGVPNSRFCWIRVV